MRRVQAPWQPGDILVWVSTERHSYPRRIDEDARTTSEDIWSDYHFAVAEDRGLVSDIAWIDNVNFIRVRKLADLRAPDYALRGLNPDALPSKAKG